MLPLPKARMQVIRKTFTKDTTMGFLRLDGSFCCYTLEDAYRTIKVPRETCIPYGIYEVIVNFSNRFKRMMPLLLNVPQFDGVRFHNGSTKDHTDGCVLVGNKQKADMVYESKICFNDTVFPWIVAACSKAHLYVEVTKE